MSESYCHGNGSKIFVPYRALGLVSNHIPLALRFIQRRKENLVVTVVGKCFHTYGCKKLDLLSVSSPHLGDISCLTVDSYHVYTAYENIIYAWRRGTELKFEYKGHESNVHLMIPFGPHLLSVDEKNILKVWDIKSQEVFLELPFSNESFSITAMMHPNTYLNKVLFGSKQGTMQLWNLRTSKLIHSFNGWNSAITVLEQAPAIDVVAVGSVSGAIYIHNLKYDETLIKFVQEWGQVTAISFRTDGHPIMASSSNVGHIAIWNLESKRLHSQIRDAHKTAVTGLKFMPDEPVLVSSSPDNSLRMWIFDQTDDTGRLLRFREGHCSPPCKIRFHGATGQNILSAGLDSTLRSFSTIVDNLNKSLGQASFNRKLAKKKGVKYDRGKLPPITGFTSETTREKEWDNIAACHRGLDLVTTWSYDRSCMGEHKLHHERFKGERNVVALCVALSACGNFVLIGYNTGHVDKYNIQSGIFRGTYGEEKAHDGAVRGIVVDALNRVSATAGSDKQINFWRFKECTLLSAVKLEEAISHIMLHRESAMLAVALDNLKVVVVDFETRRVVRTFLHDSYITDMAFSTDARWLLTSTMDAAIRTWDLPSGRLIDCFLMASACSTLTLSPTGDFLATGHVDDLGIYLWANSTLYSHVSLQPLPEDYKPQVVELPSVSFKSKSDEVTAMEVEDVILNDSLLEFKSPEQISDELVTLSTLPHSRWQNLLNLDIIKKRNKPKDPPSAPKQAPFFLPVVAGLEPKFSIEDKEQANKEDVKSKLLVNRLQPLSPFGELLLHCEDNNYSGAISKLKELNPSSIDIEIRSLSPDCGGSETLMLNFMKAINESLVTNQDFELVQSYLALFLKVHWNTIAETPELYDYIQHLKVTQRTSWEKLFLTFNKTFSILNYLKSATV